MLTAILAFFSAVPALVGGVTAFSQAFFNAKVEMVKARVGGDVDVAKQLVSGVATEGQARIEFLKTVGQSKFLMWLIGSFAFPWAFYQGKVVLWDNIVCHWFYGVYGFTPAVSGNVGEWSGLIIGSIFGSATVIGVGQMFFNRKER